MLSKISKYLSLSGFFAYAILIIGIMRNGQADKNTHQHSNRWDD
jgi:hypothetical protein